LEASGGKEHAVSGGIYIGKLFKIKIFIDWSWIFIFLLVTWSLAAGVFPSLHPDWGPARLIGLSLVASFLFFASVLAHEFAHSLVARARGMPVRRITLFIFGGVSNIEKEPESPGGEFWMAVVGPLTSLGLGILFLVIGYANVQGAPLYSRQALSQMDPLATLFFWLGPVNLLLAAFNMIPGFPLDGGQVLRSILWKISGSMRTATHLASGLGQVIAWAFIVAGIAMAFGIQIPILGTGLINGIWLEFIGWFLNNAAVQSYRQVVIDDILEGIQVGSLMHRSVPTVTPDLMISQFVDDYVMGHGEQSFPVLLGDQLVGMVSVQDVRKVPRPEWESVSIKQIMTPRPKLEVVKPDEDAADALHKLSERDVRQIPVVQAGHLVGLLRRQDIIRWLQIQNQSTAS
jgi:Zn-dependent protease/CBS domain-containing protein